MSGSPMNSQVGCVDGRLSTGRSLLGVGADFRFDEIVGRRAASIALGDYGWSSQNSSAGQPMSRTIT
jgi:hypothetical protein